MNNWNTFDWSGFITNHWNLQWIFCEICLDYNSFDIWLYYLYSFLHQDSWTPFFSVDKILLVSEWSIIIWVSLSNGRTFLVVYQFVNLWEPILLQFTRLAHEEYMWFIWRIRMYFIIMLTFYWFQTVRVAFCHLWYICVDYWKQIREFVQHWFYSPLSIYNCHVIIRLHIKHICHLASLLLKLALKASGQ